MPAAIRPFEAEHLPALQALVNAHLEAALPGWALPAPYLQDRLRHNPDQFIIDPWVRERLTLCAFEQGRLGAAAHLLRYRAGPEVGADYQNAGDLAWFLFWPGSLQAGAALLAAAHAQMAGWGVERAYACDAGLPVGLVSGVPDAWPHVAEALAAAGYQCKDGRDEAVYGGWLAELPLPGAPPLPGMSVQRTMGRLQTRFTALAGGEAIPALRGWAELGQLHVAERWRGRGVGAWLVQHAAAWLRLGGCERVVLAVDADDEAAGAGRFYQRLGWTVLLRRQLGWTRRLE